MCATRLSSHRPGVNFAASTIWRMHLEVLARVARLIAQRPRARHREPRRRASRPWDARGGQARRPRAPPRGASRTCRSGCGRSTAGGPRACRTAGRPRSPRSTSRGTAGPRCPSRAGARPGSTRRAGAAPRAASGARPRAGGTARARRAAGTRRGGRRGRCPRAASRTRRRSRSSSVRLRDRGWGAPWSSTGKTNW